MLTMRSYRTFTNIHSACYLLMPGASLLERSLELFFMYACMLLRALVCFRLENEVKACAYIKKLVARVCVT